LIHFCGTVHNHLATCRNANATRLTFSIRLVSSLHMRGMLYRTPLSHLSGTTMGVNF
jgi:hypothetical protein